MMQMLGSIDLLTDFAYSDLPHIAYSKRIKSLKNDMPFQLIPHANGNSSDRPSPLEPLKICLNKTKYTMDPGIYFLMKTDK